MTDWRLATLTLATVALALGLAGCGAAVGNEGGVVGGACSSDDDCDLASVCVNEQDFPGGTCSVACAGPADCPSGSTCTDKYGGLCLLDCERDADCRPDYRCQTRPDKGGEGKSSVCIR